MAKKTVVFKCKAPEAKRVNVTGTFNNWNPNAIAARKDSKGNWSVRVSLNPGRYEYKFVVDGAWLNDSNARERVPNNIGSANDVLVVK